MSGKRRFAGTISAESSTTTVSRYGNNHVTGHVRGWNQGILVHAFVDSEGNEHFEVWTTGGSNDTSKRKMLGTLSADGFGYTPQ